MEQEKAQRLLIRQLKDIQSQADKISNGENSSENIEAFARYSIELKGYIEKNVESQLIKSYLNELPDISYSKLNVKLWQYLILPSWWVSSYRDYQAKNQAVREINQVRGKYATLELLVRELAD